MKHYVNFVCEHIAEANRDDVNENSAIAYADIDGYPEGEDVQGSVICRVWMLREKNGQYPSYLVDWHHNECYDDKAVLELIKKAKDELVDFKKNMLEEIFQKAYDRYKVLWMMENKRGLSEYIAGVKKQITTGKALDKACHDFELHEGFDSDPADIWESEEGFRDEKWKDDNYMKKLLTRDEYSVWLTR